MTPGTLLLVKHARPVLDPARPAREWTLGPEGEVQAAAVAKRLAGYLPFDLVSSPEPKASRTAAIVAGMLGAEPRIVAGLHEFDRPVLPIMPAEEHLRLNARLFREPNRPVLGTESARVALARFTAALVPEIQARRSPNLVVVSHGTVISLFVAAHNAIDAFGFWRTLDCGGVAVLDLPSLRLAPSLAARKEGRHVVRGEVGRSA
jgi:broad specificity phosphatase PhoE